MKEQIHWRKTAKACSECRVLTSAKRFIGDSTKCIKCNWDEEISKTYKKCSSCCKWMAKNKIINSYCEECKDARNKKYSIFKDRPARDEERKYVCSICKTSKHPNAYPQESDPSILHCRACLTQQKIEKEGKFRCKSCASVFPKEEGRWNYTHCIRCCEKKKKWIRERMKYLRKEDPCYRKYYKEYNKYYYYNVIAPLYNKVFNLQWTHGLVKQRKRNFDSGFYVLNRALFEDFKNRPKYWYGVCQDAMRQMKTGAKFLHKGKLLSNDPQDPYTKDPEWIKRNSGADW